jgi:hypothetical protein
VNYTIESITSENIGTNQILQKGRAIEDEYRLEVRKHWHGSHNGGVHPNFIQALVQNEFNKADLTKFTLRVETSQYYAGFYRGQAVPVLIYVNDQGIRKQNAGPSNNQQQVSDVNPVQDTFLSGIYVITGMEIKYEQLRGMYQVFYLNKREWTLNSAGTFPKTFPINLLSR